MEKQTRKTGDDGKGVAGKEAVNHPAHYGGADNPHEHCKVARAWRLGPNLYNSTKYMSRAGKKDPKKYIEDLKKAAWYLQQEIEGQHDLELKGGRP